MARLSKAWKTAISLVMIFALAASVMSTSAFSLSEEEEAMEREVHSVEYCYGGAFGMDSLCYETVDGVEYIYIVEDSEATILNIQILERESDDMVLTLPSKLGGYTVTTIGSDEHPRSVFWYIWHGEEVELSGGGYPEYDPDLRYVSKIIIPEGYEYIVGNYTFYGFGEFEFPRSLKKIKDVVFDGAFYDDYEKGIVIFPECKYDFIHWDFFHLFLFESDKYSEVIAPSRDLSMAESLFYELHDGTLLYVPYNLSYNDVATLFYNTTYDPGAPKIETGASFKIACAPDCKWLQVFDDYAELSNYAYDIEVTYVTPATSIAFDSESVTLAVGDVQDIYAKTYPEDAVWTACDYVSSDPEIVKVDPYSGRVTALSEGTATITATHVERGFTDSYTVTVTPYVEHVCTPSDEWTTDENYHWHECTDTDCTEISDYAEHSGGTATASKKAVCEYCGAAYGEYAKSTLAVTPVSDVAYCSYGNREYAVTVTGSPDKIQFIRSDGGTSTHNRSAAQITDNGDGTETWVLTARLNKGTYTVAAKYGRVWNKNGTEFEIVFATPSCRNFTSETVNGVTTFKVVTDPQVTKIQFIMPKGSTMTYTTANSYIGEDGLRYWTVSRKLSAHGTYGLKIKYGYTWLSTDFTAEA